MAGNPGGGGVNPANDDGDREIRKKLDEVVGTRFDPEAREGLAGRVRRGVVRWVAAAVLAVIAASLVVYTIESHRLPTPEAMKATNAKKPVEVLIIPSR
jgi:hypothetical protein